MNSTILILGDGRSLHDDMQRFYDWQIPHDTAALGRGIKECPNRVRHWFNADGESAIHWAKNLPNGNGTVKHTTADIDGFDYWWEIEQPDYRYGEITNEKPERMHGSSAMFAVLSLITIGYTKIVLAGCPLDCEGHYYYPQRRDTYGPIWLGHDFMAWLDLAEGEKGQYVRSLSGYTAKILGLATREWMLK